MKFPTQPGNLIFSAEQYRLALKFKFKAFLRNFKQLIRAPAADEMLGLVIAHDVVTLRATEITTITLISGHGLSSPGFFAQIVFALGASSAQRRCAR
jgi:predicted naringenin-chalcone synthase